MNIISIARDVSIRKIEAGDLEKISAYEYSVSIIESHADLDRLRQLHSESSLWDEQAGAVAIVENSTKRFVGTCQFYRAAPCIHGLEIGYIVHDKSDRGKGFASQSLRLLSNHLFSTRTSIHRHQLMIEVWNTASWKVAERAGFIRDGLLRSSGFGEDPADCFVYSRTKRDFDEELKSSNGPSS